METISFWVSSIKYLSISYFIFSDFYRCSYHHQICMEKLKNFRNSFFILLVISHFFLWEIKLFNINLKFLILFAYIFILLDYKNFLNKFYNYKTLIFLLIFIHLYINAEEFSFYLFKTYFFLFLISCLVIFFKNEILLAFKKSFYLFNILLFLILFFQFF